MMTDEYIMCSDGSKMGYFSFAKCFRVLRNGEMLTSGNFLGKF